MAWVVDRQIESLRDSVLDRLDLVANQDGYVQHRVKTIMDITHTSIGEGHTDGDRLVQDAAQVTVCLQRAQSSIQRAMGEISAVNIMMWVSES